MCLGLDCVKRIVARACVSRQGAGPRFFKVGCFDDPSHFGPGLREDAPAAGHPKVWGTRKSSGGRIAGDFGAGPPERLQDRVDVLFLGERAEDVGLQGNHRLAVVALAVAVCQ